MKRIALILILFISLIACKKRDSENDSANINSFTVNGSTYIIKESYQSSTEFYGKDSFNNYARITFPGSSPAEKDFDIVESGSDLIDNQVVITFSRNNLRFYSTGRPSAKLNLSRPNGKLKVTCPDIWLKSDIGQNDDSVKFSCNIIQTR